MRSSELPGAGEHEEDTHGYATSGKATLNQDSIGMMVYNVCRIIRRENGRKEEARREAFLEDVECRLQGNRLDADDRIIPQRDSVRENAYCLNIGRVGHLSPRPSPLAGQGAEFAGGEDERRSDFFPSAPAPCRAGTRGMNVRKGEVTLADFGSSVNHTRGDKQSGVESGSIKCSPVAVFCQATRGGTPTAANNYTTELPAPGSRASCWVVTHQSQFNGVAVPGPFGKAGVLSAPFWPSFSTREWCVSPECHKSLASTLLAW